MLRTEIRQLMTLGRFPAESTVNQETIQQQQVLLEAIQPPVSNDEACELAALFGDDDYFGLAWTLLHLIETAPQWPLEECLEKASSEWKQRLKARVERDRERRRLM